MVVVEDHAAAQRMAGLRLANEVRSRRAQLKRDVAAGRASALRVLSEPPEWLLKMRVFDLVLAIPRVGRVRANRAMNQAGVSPARLVGELTARQRAALVSAIGARS